MTSDYPETEKAPADVAAGKHDFQWVHWVQDHDKRKAAILAQHGDEVRALMAVDPVTKWWVTGMVLVQLALSVYFRHSSWPIFALASYFGGTIFTHSLFLGIHEVTHHTVFKTPWLNDALAMWANVPIVFPYAMMFKDYHADHHRYLNWDGMDTDLPTNFEMRFLDSFAGKFFFLTFQIFFYAFRPMIVKQKPLKARHFAGILVQLSFVALWLKLWGFWAIAFLVLSDVLAGTFSLTSGHFIAEHYNIFGAHVHQDTFSYYGLWNAICYNVGYHNEHHDFPSIPWTRLPQLREIAKEFYDPLVATKSWWLTSWTFLTDPNVGLYSRMRRERGAGLRTDLKCTDTARNPFLDALLEKAKNAPVDVNKNFKK